ncbi:MAG: lytic transglycosylase domain-containing protein [Elusimicrobiota bacterium]
MPHWAGQLKSLNRRQKFPRAARGVIFCLFASTALFAGFPAILHAQGWRDDAGILAGRNIPSSIVAQAAVPAWNAEKLNRLFDADLSMPAAKPHNPKTLRARKRVFRRFPRRRHRRIDGYHAPMPIIPDPKLTPAYRRTFEMMMKEEGATDRYDGIIIKYSARYGLDPRLVKSIIAAESEFQMDARSPKGARGLMQVMPRTARYMGISRENLANPEANIKAGTAYLAELFQSVTRFYGLGARAFAQPPLWLTERVIACYHAGPRFLRHDRWLRQTKLYVRRVLLFYRSKVSRFHWAPQEPASDQFQQRLQLSR